MDLERIALGCALCAVFAGCRYEGLQRPLGVAEMQVPLPSGTPADQPERAAAPVTRGPRAAALYARARQMELEGRCPEAQDAYEQYASVVGDTDPGSAQMAIAYERGCHARAATDPRDTEAAAALVARDYPRVLAITAGSPGRPADTWMLLDRAEALAALGRTDDAVALFRRGADELGRRDDPSGRAKALWGAARALDEAGRCDEAKRAYGDYEVLVRPVDARAGDMAARYARTCREIIVQR